MKHGKLSDALEMVDPRPAIMSATDTIEGNVFCELEFLSKDHLYRFLSRSIYLDVLTGLQVQVIGKKIIAWKINNKKSKR